MIVLFHYPWCYCINVHSVVKKKKNLRISIKVFFGSNECCEFFSIPLNSKTKNDRIWDNLPALSYLCFGLSHTSVRTSQSLAI